MNWIAIHEAVLGSKLRGLRKRLKCSDAEALGILTILWLWARRNADVTGLLANTDREDISDAIKTSISSYIDPLEATEAMIEEGWIDEVDGQLYIHDWSEWQSQWYSFLEKKKRDADRKRNERAKAKEIAREESDAKEESEEPPKVPAPQVEEEPKPKPKRQVRPKKPPKTEYSKYVSMYPEEMEKLIEMYGEAFTQKLVEELDFYKGASGKTYKDDYRAILSWVVDKCEKKYPQLKKRLQIAPMEELGNPFDAFK